MNLRTENYECSFHWNRYTKRRFDAGVPLVGGRIGATLERDRLFKFWKRDVENNINAKTAEPPAYKTPASTSHNFIIRWFRYLLFLFGLRSSKE